MATQKDIEEMYDWVDHFQSLVLGKWSDFSCAFFDGNYNKSLDQAQKDKHEWVLHGVNAYKKNSRIIDIGCGWGPILKATKDKGGSGLGLTLSRAQAKFCTDNGLDVRILDWKNANPKDLGKFDAVISIGAFEHFCSVEEFKAGKQEEIYRYFFNFCAKVLPIGGRLYLQTMIWGNTVPDPDSLQLGAPKGSTERILARLRKFYPGSWLPKSKIQIINTAKPTFKLIRSNNGRMDYIETQNRWMASAIKLWSFPTILKSFPAMLRLVPRLLTDSDFRVQIESIFHYDQRTCFEKSIMTHERMFFERIR